MPQKATVNRICEKCGKHFLCKPAEVKRGKGRFCSHGCAAPTVEMRRARELLPVKPPDGFQPVHGYPRYFISREGVIIGPRSAVKPHRNRQGYWFIMAWVKGRAKTLQIHRALLLAYVGPCLDKCEARHLNDISDDNRLCNLAWGTRADNMADKIRNGRVACGERNGSAKLTASQVKTIRQLITSRSARSLGRQFGVSHSTILKIVKGERWKSVKA